MSFIGTCLENYYQGRTSKILSLTQLNDLSPCIDNIVFLTGVADREINSVRYFQDLLFVNDVCAIAKNLSERIGLEDLKKQLESRRKKQLSRFEFPLAFYFP